MSGDDSVSPEPVPSASAESNPTPAPSDTPETPVDITPESVEDLLIPAGACGNGTEIGWNQRHPVQLSEGTGEYYDNSGAGAGILSTTLVGAVDLNEDGARDAVLVLECTGTPVVDCCAGRTSILNAVVALELGGRYPRLLAEPLFATYVEDPDEDGAREIVEAALSGTKVLVNVALVYPEDAEPSFVAANEGWFRYALTDGRWEEAER